MLKCICSGITPTARAILGRHHADTCPLYRDEVPELFDQLGAARAEAEAKAIDSLARYKFAMFGYWAGVWVHLNRLMGDRQPNPFKHLVEAAKKGAVNANS